jgi:hypothetical protein
LIREINNIALREEERRPSWTSVRGIKEILEIVSIYQEPPISFQLQAGINVLSHGGRGRYETGQDLHHQPDMSRRTTMKILVFVGKWQKAVSARYLLCPFGLLLQ